MKKIFEDIAEYAFLLILGMGIIIFLWFKFPNERYYAVLCTVPYIFLFLYVGVKLVEEAILVNGRKLFPKHLQEVKSFEVASDTIIFGFLATVVGSIILVVTTNRYLVIPVIVGIAMMLRGVINLQVWGTWECPNCKEKGGLYPQKSTSSKEIRRYVSLVTTKNWTRCAKCNHEYNHKESSYYHDYSPPPTPKGSVWSDRERRYVDYFSDKEKDEIKKDNKSYNSNRW